MGSSVQTGSTKSTSGLSLISEKLQTEQGEQVVLLLQIHASTTEAKSLGKECTTLLTDSLLETEGDAGTRLDGALKELNGLIKGFLISKSIEDIHAIIAILGKDNVLHVSHAGRAEAYIIRSGAASQITEYTKGKPTPAFVHIASGAVEPSDIVIFSTQRLLRTLTPAQLATLAAREKDLLSELISALDSEKEKAALALICIDGASKVSSAKSPSPVRSDKRRARGRSLNLSGILQSSTESALGAVGKLRGSRWMTAAKTAPTKVLTDLKDPKKKKKAHFLILAAALALFLVIWAGAKLTTTSQRSQTRAELETLMTQIDGDIRSADNRYLTGDIDSANAILQRAEEQAKQVMDNESGLFRMEALDVLDRIRLKKEEINNIVRLSPRVSVNLSAKSPNILAMGLLGVEDGELVAYDRENLYRILLNSVDEPDSLSTEELIVDGTYFERMQTLLFQMSDNSIIEVISGVPTTMKTDDPAGWVLGKALVTYLRFLYVLSPENNQIYKYERLSNRFGPPSEYNVNGDLTGAIDLAIDGNIFVLKDSGEILKLFRGEVKPFVIRHLPEGSLATATRIFKAFDGNIYILDPEESRVIVVTDGGATGESSYIRQYILEGDQMTTLQDLYVDPDELHLYVLDEKRVYSIDIVER